MDLNERSRRAHLPALLLLVSAAFGWPTSTEGAIIEAVTIEDLTVLSDSVVRGRVVGLESRLVDGGRGVVTLVEVEVLEDYRDADAERLEIVLPGGAQGDFVQRVSGMPSFARGDEVIVFLELHPSTARRQEVSRFSLMAMSLGVFFIEDGVAFRKTDGLKVVTGPLQGDRPTEVSLSIPRGELEERIRLVLGRTPR